MAERPLRMEPTATGYRIQISPGDLEALVHARWHAVLDDPARGLGPIGDHVRQVIAAAEARALRSGGGRPSSPYRPALADVPS